MASHIFIRDCRLSRARQRLSKRGVRVSTGAPCNAICANLSIPDYLKQPVPQIVWSIGSPAVDKTSDKLATQLATTCDILGKSPLIVRRNEDGASELHSESVIRFIFNQLMGFTVKSLCQVAIEPVLGEPYFLFLTRTPSSC